MNKLLLSFLIVILFVVTGFAQPITLHPENPHYFFYKGKPTLLITSAEHYGAVLNGDFDFEKYLKTMHAEGMNYTRIFSGAYVEIPESFSIRENTLAPKEGRYLAPWKRTGEPGLYKGEMKFDFTKWNPAYFERLKSFIGLANELDIVVEVTFFCSTYNDGLWERNPFNSGNNVNNLPTGLDRKKSNTIENGVLTGFQKKLVKKIVTELNDYDNVIYEIQNEPWSDNPQNGMRTLRTTNPGNKDYYLWSKKASDISLEWQKQMAEVVAETEKSFAKKHLIAQNYTNFKYSVERVDSNISILNFHYAWPEAVWLNYGWNLPVAFDESGFAGSKTDTYLRQAWQFILAGGAVFNNLDYSFFVGSEDGTGVNSAPGAGSTQLRKQLKFMRSFIESFDFIKMHPDFNVVAHAPGAEWQCISEPGKQYAIVFEGVNPEWIKLNLPDGKYNYQFVSPFSGKTLKTGFIKHKKNEQTKLQMPEFKEMVVLKIVK